MTCGVEKPLAPFVLQGILVQNSTFLNSTPLLQRGRQNFRKIKLIPQNYTLG